MFHRELARYDVPAHGISFPILSEAVGIFVASNQYRAPKLSHNSTMPPMYRRTALAQNDTTQFST